MFRGAYARWLSSALCSLLLIASNANSARAEMTDCANKKPDAAAGWAADDARTIGSACLNKLKEDTIKAVRAETWAEIPAYAFSDLDRRFLARLDHVQLAAMTPEQWRAVPRVRVRKLKFGQIAAVDLNKLPEQTLRTLTRWQVKHLTDEQLRTLKDEKAWSFDNEQLLAMSPHQLRMLASDRGEQAKERLKELEDSQLRAMIALDPGVRLIGDAYAQLQEAAAASDESAEKTASFGVGLDIQEPLWSARLTVRGGSRERLIDGSDKADGSRGDHDGFGLALLNPQGQAVYIGALGRFTLRAGSKVIIAVKTDLNVSNTRWKVSLGEPGARTTSEKVATTFSSSLGPEFWLPFAQGANYTDVRLFLGLTAHAVGLRDEAIRKEALDTPRVIFFGPMLGLSLRINAIEVHSDLRWLQKDVSGLSGASLITYISFAPGAKLASFCHSMSCATGIKPGARELQGADLRNSIRSGDNLAGYALDGADFRQAKLIGTNLMLATLRRADLREADLHGADLRQADVRNAQLGAADLGAAKLDSALLHEADLSKVKAQNASFRDAHLDDAILAGANLTDANFTEAKLPRAKFVKFASDGTTIVDGFVAILRNANLTGADLTGVDLSSADLTGATLTNAKLEGANLKGATLANVKFEGADLTNAKLEGAKLGGATLVRTNMQGVTFDAQTDRTGIDKTTISNMPAGF